MKYSDRPDPVTYNFAKDFVLWHENERKRCDADQGVKEEENKKRTVIGWDVRVCVDDTIVRTGKCCTQTRRNPKASCK
jgi:hypothetical protein